MRCLASRQCHMTGGANTSMVCDSPFCNVQCDDKNCSVDCKKTGCNVQCIAGNCQVNFSPSSSGTLYCFGGNCKVRCPTNQSCDIKYCPGNTCSVEFYQPPTSHAPLSSEAPQASNRSSGPTGAQVSVHVSSTISFIGCLVIVLLFFTWDLPI